MRRLACSFLHLSRRCLGVAIALGASAFVFVEAGAQSAHAEVSHGPCDASHRTTECTPRPASLVQLIATPGRFDGKIVKVIGFVHYGFEDSALYLHREDFESNLISNSIGIDLRAEVAKGHTMINDHYVLLEGTFHARDGGITSGELTDITDATLWPSRATMRRGPRGFQVLKARPPVPPATKP